MSKGIRKKNKSWMHFAAKKQMVTQDLPLSKIICLN